MKRNQLFLVLLLAFVMFPSSIKAICYNKDKTRFMSFANNINSTYVFDENTKTFNIIINNIYEGFIINDVNKNIKYTYKKPELILNGYKPGGSYRFDILTDDIDCSDVTLRSIYINLPTYNPNYVDPLCEGLEEYDVCQKWGKYINDHSEFERQISNLKIEKNNNEKNVKVEEEYFGVFDRLARIFVKSYYIVLPIIIIGCLFGIYKLNKKDRLF